MEAATATTHERRAERAPGSVGGSPARAKKKKGKKRKSYDPYDEGPSHEPHEAYYSDGEPVYMDGGEPVHRWTCSNCGTRLFDDCARPRQRWCYVCYQDDGPYKRDACGKDAAEVEARLCAMQAAEEEEARMYLMKTVEAGSRDLMDAEVKEAGTHIRWADSSEGELGAHKRWVAGPGDGFEDGCFNDYDDDSFVSSENSDPPGEYSPDDSFDTIFRRIKEIEAFRASARAEPKDRPDPKSDSFAYWPDGSRSLRGHRATTQTKSIHRHAIVPTTAQVKEHVAAHDGRSMAQRFASRGERDLYDEKLRYAYRSEPIDQEECLVPRDTSTKRLLEAMQSAVDAKPLHPDRFPDDYAYWPYGSRGLLGACETTLSKTSGRMFIVPMSMQVDAHFAASNGMLMADRFAPIDKWCSESVPLFMSVSGGGVGSG